MKNPVLKVAVFVLLGVFVTSGNAGPVAIYTGATSWITPEQALVQAQVRCHHIPPITGFAEQRHGPETGDVWHVAFQVDACEERCHHRIRQQPIIESSDEWQQVMCGEGW